MIQIAATPKTAPLGGWVSDRLTDLGIAHGLQVGGAMTEIEGLIDTEILVSIMVPCGASEMDAMPGLRAIVSPLLGYDWIDVPAATERNIVVVNGEVEENRLGMAEATVMLLLTQFYALRETERALRDGNPANMIRRNLVRGKTIGILGSGGIARLVIERLTPWGCDILVSDAWRPDGLAPARFAEMDELLATSDAILVLTNLTPETRHLLGRDEFAKIKPGAILVNTARGGLIDENALLAALADGTIRTAALDVFEQEPLRPDHPFRAEPNLILTPHCIGHNEEGRLSVPRVAAENVRTLLSGALPASCKNASIGDSWKQKASAAG